MKIIVASDHGGFAAKQTLTPWLEAQGFEVLDAGATTLDPLDDYPDFVWRAFELWKQHPDSRLLLWCRSGVGVCLAANRFTGLSCGLGFDPRQIINSTRDDGLNALALPSDFLTLDQQKEFIIAFLSTSNSTHGKYLARLEILASYVNRHHSRST